MLHEHAAGSVELDFLMMSMRKAQVQDLTQWVMFALSDVQIPKLTFLSRINKPPCSEACANYFSTRLNCKILVKGIWLALWKDGKSLDARGSLSI